MTIRTIAEENVLEVMMHYFDWKFIFHLIFCSHFIKPKVSANHHHMHFIPRFALALYFM
jgi:hypothetical protein